MLRYSRRGLRPSDDDVKLFISTADMNSDSPRGHKGRQHRPELQREYSDLTKQKHEEVVMKLLEDFDIEDTKDKYRCSRGEITYVPKRRG